MNKSTELFAIDIDIGYILWNVIKIFMCVCEFVLGFKFCVLIKGNEEQLNNRSSNKKKQAKIKQNKTTTNTEETEKKKSETVKIIEVILLITKTMNLYVFIYRLVLFLFSSMFIYLGKAKSLICRLLAQYNKHRAFWIIRFHWYLPFISLVYLKICVFKRFLAPIKIAFKQIVDICAANTNVLFLFCCVSQSQYVFMFWKPDDDYEPNSIWDLGRNKKNEKHG